MNVVKMQDSLKDFSDRQLLQTMESGSAPQYLVLAEMQRRKKARENPANTEPQPETSVADDIMGGITGLPMRPMQMAEGGIVSFAAGGKTGRMKGEEEACWTDTRTGEKYCPPDTPQTEMPRTGQRKSFQEGGPVGIPPDEMAEIEVQRRLQELRATNPNVTEYDAMQDLMREGSSVVPAMYGSDTPSTSAAQASPAESMPQPEPMSEPFQDGIGSLPVVQPGGDSQSRYDRIADQNFFGNLEDNLTSTLRSIAPGSGSGMDGTGEFPPPGGSPTAQSSAGLPFIRYGDEPLIPPREAEDVAEASRRTAREQAEDQTAGRPAAEPTGDDQEAELNRLAPAPEPPPRPTQPQQPEYQDGLMQRMEELRAERDRTEDSARKEAINQALIQAGLSMMASDNPDFLGALGEGGIQGLAAYSGAQQAAQERQGAIGDEMTDLMIARESNDLRRQAAQASAMSDQARAQQAEIGNLIDMLESEQKQLVEQGAMLGEEESAAAQQRINMLRNRINQLMGTGDKKTGVEGPESKDTVKIPGD